MSPNFSFFNYFNYGNKVTFFLNNTNLALIALFAVIFCCDAFPFLSVSHLFRIHRRLLQSHWCL